MPRLASLHSGRRTRSARLALPQAVLTALAAGFCVLAAAAGRPPAAAAEMLRLRCTNPASGASFPVVVDLDHRRVDRLAATITDKWISWRDPKRGFFDLERASGRLQLRNASSTGGYFLNFTCRDDEAPKK